MKNKDSQIRLLVRALYEIRVLLANKVARADPEDINVTIAANLAYALHNQALAILDGKEFDYDVAISRIRWFDEQSGTEFCDYFEKQLAEYF